MQTVRELYKELDAAQSVPDKVEALSKLAFLFLNQDPERCRAKAEEMLRISGPENYLPGMVEGHLVLARMHYRTSCYTDSLENYNKARSFFTDDYDDKILRAKIVDGLGMVYSSTGNVDQSLMCHQEAITLYREGGDTKGLEANSLNNIANCYGRKGDFETSERYYRKALDVLERQGNGKFGTNIRANMAAVMNEYGKHQEALQQFLQCKAEFEERQQYMGIAMVTLNLGHTYLCLKDYGEAVRHYVASFKLLKPLDNRESIASAYRGLGQVYYALQGYDDAVKNLEAAITIYKQIDNPSGTIDSLAILTAMHHETGMNRLATDCLQEAFSVAESKQLTFKIAELQALKDKLKLHL